MNGRMTGLLRRLAGDRRGALIAEAAMSISVLVSMSLTGLEFARYTLLHQKMERVAAEIGDLVSREDTITNADFTNIFAAINQVATPFDVEADGKVIVSAVGVSGGGPLTMYWQKASGVYGATSHIGTPGNTVTLPSGFSISTGSTAIIAEVTYHYTPWVLPGMIATTEVYHTAFFRPRFGTLNSIK